MMLARPSPSRVRRFVGAALVAVLAASAGLAAWAQTPSQPQSQTRAESTVISQLMHAPSDEEQDLTRARMNAVMTPAPERGITEQTIAMLRNAPPPDRMSRLNVMHAGLMGAMGRDYPRKRAIPEGQLIEARVSVRLPTGETVGPFRMTSGVPDGFSSREFANGDKDFFADGNERFIGAVLGSVEPDGGLLMNFGLVIEGQPVSVIGFRSKSGVTTAAELAGGYRLIVDAQLRSMNAAELRRYARGAQAVAKVPPHDHVMINPDWPGPIMEEQRQQPEPDLSSLANASIACGDWKTKFSNDPAVDTDRIGAAEIAVKFDAAGKGSISLPTTPGAFGVAFPAGLVSQEVRVTQRPDRLNYWGRSPQLADLFNLSGVDQPSPALTWERIRRDGEITYRTKFFLRCRK